MRVFNQSIAPDVQAKQTLRMHIKSIAPIIPHMILVNISLVPTEVVVQSLLVADLRLLADIQLEEKEFKEYTLGAR